MYGMGFRFFKVLGFRLCKVLGFRLFKGWDLPFVLCVGFILIMCWIRNKL